MVELASILSFLTLPFVSEDRINIAQTGTYEVEGGALKGTQVENTAHGYTGAGYVAPYANSVRSLTVVVVVPSTPLYNIGVIYEAPYGDGCTSVTLNGTPNGKIYFPVSSTFTKMSGYRSFRRKARTLSPLQATRTGIFSIALPLKSEKSQTQTCSWLTTPTGATLLLGITTGSPVAPTTRSISRRSCTSTTILSTGTISRDGRVRQQAAQ